MINLEVPPSDFWKMTPEEFRWLYEFKYPEEKQKSEEIARLKKLFDLPEARPSKGIKNGSNT